MYRLSHISHSVIFIRERDRELSRHVVMKLLIGQFMSDLQFFIPTMRCDAKALHTQTESIKARRSQGIFSALRFRQLRPRCRLDGWGAGLPEGFFGG